MTQPLITPEDLKQVYEEPCELYAPDGTLIGTVEGSLAFNNVRIKIMEARAEGYYVMFRNMKLDINKHGRLERWPVGFFDILDNQLIKLIGESFHA